MAGRRLQAVGRPASSPVSRTRGCSSFLFPCVYNDANQYLLYQYEMRETHNAQRRTHTYYCIVFPIPTYSPRPAADRIRVNCTLIQL